MAALNFQQHVLVHCSADSMHNFFLFWLMFFLDVLESLWCQHILWLMSLPISDGPSFVPLFA